jgi:hypothetical protein
MGRVTKLALLIGVAIGLLAGSSSAGAYSFGPTVQQLGPEKTVFDWSTQACNSNFAADSPARAWKDSAGKVHLTISSNASYAMVGTSLNNVAVDCAHTLLPSDFNADPSTYDDQEWVVSPYTADGTNVYALIHDEYHGWEHQGMCDTQGRPPRPKLLTTPVAGYNPGCWYNAITYATSTDGGYTFTHAVPPAHLVASVPYVYQQYTSAYGYFSPSNVIRKSDGYFYVVWQAEAYGAQQIGVCEARTKNPTNPASWRGWNGTSYSVQFIDPYTNPQPPEQHVCAPVAWNEIEKMVQSLTYNSYFQKYLLVGQTQDWDPQRREYVYGAYYSTSTDLINWSHRALLMEAELPWSYQCGDDNPIAYPVVLNPGPTTSNPDSAELADRNFSTTGQTTYLYFTRFNYVNCTQNYDLDLIRIPIKFIGPPAP